MLVLKLKALDQVKIDDTTIHVREIGNGRVRLAIDAPKEVPISNGHTPCRGGSEGGKSPPSD